MWFWNESKSFLFNINNAFFEFIKLDDTHEEHPTTYFLDELEVDQAYEVVISQASGLYRYRMGDIFRVTGFHENCPKMEFMYRLGLLLNLRNEKIGQKVAGEGLQAAVAQRPDVRLIEYAFAESTLIPETSTVYEEDEIMPYYLVFMELWFEPGKQKASSLIDHMTSLIDAEIRSRNRDYECYRLEGSISAPRVHIVKPNTFEDLKALILTTTKTSANQYKVPRKIRTVEMLNFMLDHCY